LRSLSKSPRATLARRLPNLPFENVGVGVFKGFSVLEMAIVVVGGFCVFSIIFRRGWLVLYGSGLERAVICFKRVLFKLQAYDDYKLAVDTSVVVGRLEQASKRSEGLEFSVSFNMHRRLEV